MAKTLTHKAAKLAWILRLTNLIPPSAIKNALKLSSFRRALKLALTDYNKGIEEISAVYQKDLQEYGQKRMTLEAELKDEKVKEKAKKEKELKELVKAISDLEKEGNEKLGEYEKENDKDVTVTFDNEAYLYVTDLFGETAAQMFGQVIKDVDGNIKQEAYDTGASDELFDILEKAK